MQKEPVELRNALFIRLLKVLRQPTTGFALLGAHQAQSPSFRQPYVLFETKLHEIGEIHSFANQFGFVRDSSGTQLNLSFVMVVSCRRLFSNLMSSALRIYMYCDISNIVPAETRGGLAEHIQLPGNITNERFSWVPGRFRNSAPIKGKQLRKDG
ncbi:hypothetical protein CSKR_104879 [Clonorchis sinensis]|uniref:Uncharacterized protein n=1 Tax=Clonorchis sinensis TaxID=79923 RepID=A0A419PXI8_CLOSI|nr:hypothetical protein CSKR_104879 [Clonorchis sinensis]